MELKSRVVLDTNILVSALIGPGVCRDFVYQLLEAPAEIVLSDYILAEAEEVLKRNKFKNRVLLEALWESVKKASRIVKIATKMAKTPLRDPGDHPILLTAKLGKAGFIVTGDDDLLVLEKWKKVRILTIKEFQSGHKL